MVQTTLTDIRQNDTARLFRDDADIMAIRPSAAPANNRNRSPLLRPDEDDGKPKSFDPNGDSDAAILLRRSGYRQTDEKTREGVYHVNEERSEAAVVQRAATAAAQSATQTLTAQAKSWMRSCQNAASRIASGIGGAVESVSDFVASIPEKAGNALQSLKNGAASIGKSISDGFDTYVAKPFDTYVAKPVGSFVSAAADKANTYVVQPAKAAAGWVAGKASAAYDWAFGDDDKPAAAKPAAHAPAAKPHAPAAAQPLAGQKNNVSSGFSLSGAFDSAVDGAKDLLGWSTPAPKAAPAPHR